LWKDLQKVFKGDRKKSIAHYMLSEDKRFLMLNDFGVLRLDGNGEITAPSLLKAVYGDDVDDSGIIDMEEFQAKYELNDALKDKTFPYLEALDTAINFNKQVYYTRKGEKSSQGTKYKGLMAIPKKLSDGRYSIVIVERTPVHENMFAKHV
jgi:hypothetical protein